MDYNNTHKVELAKKIYLYLAPIFITSLVVSNLIFQKFISWHPFDVEILGNKLFVLSPILDPSDKYVVLFFNI